MSFDCRRTNCLHRLGFLPNFVKELEQRRRKLQSGQCCNRKCWDQRKRKNHLNLLKKWVGQTRKANPRDSNSVQFFHALSRRSYDFSFPFVTFLQ